MSGSFMEKTYLNKEVQIYPSDTHPKWGIVRDIKTFGVSFEITKAHSSSGYKVGEIRFISYSANLSFRLLDPDKKKTG